jgi:hypothetical protein
MLLILRTEITSVHKRVGVVPHGIATEVYVYSPPADRAAASPRASCGVAMPAASAACASKSGQRLDVPVLPRYPYF